MVGEAQRQGQQGDEYSDDADHSGQQHPADVEGRVTDVVLVEHARQERCFDAERQPADEQDAGDRAGSTGVAPALRGRENRHRGVV